MLMDQRSAFTETAVAIHAMAVLLILSFPSLSHAESVSISHKGGFTFFASGGRTFALPRQLHYSCLPSVLSSDKSCPESKTIPSASEYVLWSGVRLEKPEFEVIDYAYILKAQELGLVRSREAIRSGLETVTLNVPQRDPSLKYFIATKLKDAQGNPPVSSCTVGEWHRSKIGRSEYTTGTGSIAFFWKPGVLVSFRWAEPLCQKWPEIYSFIQAHMKDAYEEPPSSMSAEAASKPK